MPNSLKHSTLKIQVHNTHLGFFLKKVKNALSKKNSSKNHKNRGKLTSWLAKVPNTNDLVKNGESTQR